jgi:LysM repeat protein
VLALASGAAAACGGGSSGTQRLDVSKVPTATLPATLPEAKLVGSGAVQSGGATSYTVKSGDTLAGIAAGFGVSLEDLRAANPNIDGSTLSIGQSVRLPAASEAPAAAATAEPTKAAATPTEGATTAATATEAAPAATPAPAATGTPVSVGQTYAVVEGDIPLTIAEKFGITVEELMAANPGLDPTALKIGQVLIIPPKRQP